MVRTDRWSPEPTDSSAFPRNRISRHDVAKRAALAGVILALASLVYWRFSTSAANGLADSPRPGANLKFEKLTGTGQSRLAAISPDGKYLAYTRGLKDKSSIWLRHLVTNTNVEIVPAGSLVYGLAFAHSSAYLYFVRSEPRVLQRVSLLGGAPSAVRASVRPAWRGAGRGCW